MFCTHTCEKIKERSWFVKSLRALTCSSYHHTEAAAMPLNHNSVDEILGRIRTSHPYELPSNSYTRLVSTVLAHFLNPNVFSDSLFLTIMQVKISIPFGNNNLPVSPLSQCQHFTEYCQFLACPGEQQARPSAILNQSKDDISFLNDRTNLLKLINQQPTVI